MTHTIHITDRDDDAFADFTLDALRKFNASKAGPSHARPLAVEIHDAQGQPLGGLTGSTSFGWLFIKIFVISESLRGQGVGTAVMQAAEREAVARGCHSAWLDTFEFQARRFYEKLGYSCFGQLPDYPVGHRRFFMRKSLVSPAES